MELNGATMNRSKSGKFISGTKHLVTHGMAKTKIYNVWSNMKGRCENPNHSSYKNYGGRGIYVEERWKTFELFYLDMGIPKDGMTLERIDNDGPYSKDNCIWATRATQSRNKRNTVKLEINGELKSLAEWSKLSGIKPATIWARINILGWNPKKAVFSARYNGEKYD